MSRHTRPLALSILLVATGVLVACGVKVDTKREGFPCDPDGGCAAGLLCDQGTCVTPAHAHHDGGTADGGVADAGAGDGGIADGGGTDGGASDAGAADGGPACGTDAAHPCAGCGDGTTCTTGPGQAGVCSAGACFHGCLVEGTPYAPGAADPGNACQVCDPSVNPTGFVAAADLTPCASDQNPCTDDVCAAGACTHPASAQGTSCGGTGQCDGSGTCSAGCDIGTSHYAAGAVDPADPCQVCDPATSGTAWTQAAAGSGCGTGQVCDATGACRTGCYVGGTLYAAGDANPANACETCDPATSTGAFTPVANDTACGTIQGCGAWGACGAAAGASTCATTGVQSRTCSLPTCQAGACASGSVTQQQSCTLATDGLACAPDANPCTADLCSGGSCTHPALATGATCGTGKVCDLSGACVTGCTIGGQTYLPGTPSPTSLCMVCDPASSTTAWTPGNAGATCATGGCGAWGTCSYASTCTNSGNQQRTCTAYTCGGGTCNAATTTQVQACTRDTTGTSCGATSCGAWSACTYSGTCSNSGSRTRTCTSYACGSGTCNATSSTQTDTTTCTRNTNGVTCGIGCNSSCSSGVCTAHCPSNTVCKCGGQCLTAGSVCP